MSTCWADEEAPACWVDGDEDAAGCEAFEDDPQAAPHAATKPITATDTAVLERVRRRPRAMGVPIGAELAALAARRLWAPRLVNMASLCLCYRWWEEIGHQVQQEFRLATVSSWELARCQPGRR